MPLFATKYRTSRNVSVVLETDLRMLGLCQLEVIRCGDCVKMRDPPVLKPGYDAEKQPVVCALSRCETANELLYAG